MQAVLSGVSDLSIEQAAHRRGSALNEIVHALEEIERANGRMFELVELIRERHDAELAEIRDDMLALSNRIEAATRR